MKRKTNQQVAALTNRTTFRVRFSEIDSMQIVWHGEYVRYFEDVSSNNHYLLVKKRLSRRAILPVRQPR